MKIKIKPLSVNHAWRGRRFKTDRYKLFEKQLLLLLKPMDIPDGPLAVVYIFGLSSKTADWDNPIKPFQDVLQKYYGFDDRRIYKAAVEKVDVKKGDEFIKFEITSLNQSLLSSTPHQRQKPDKSPEPAQRNTALTD